MVEVRAIPAPDAQERLRRIFIILAKHIAEDGLAALEADSAMEDRDEEEG